MNKARLNRINKMLAVKFSDYELMAFIHPYKPEDDTYTVWNGVPGTGSKQITKEEWEQLAQNVPEGNVISFIDDISGNDELIKKSQEYVRRMSQT